MHRIIAISGLKDSGKSTAASMLTYLLNAPKCFRTYWWYKHLKKWPSKKWKLTAFAEPLKKCLSVILNRPLEWFEDRENKEKWYVALGSLTLHYNIEADDLKLSESKFQKLLKTKEPITHDYMLSVRQLMQYFGTEVVRRFIGDKTWINATLNKRSSNNIIISDLRFRVELEEIKYQKGTTIYINRNSAVPGSHASEREVLELLNENQFDYIIQNNGSLEDLFNCLKSIM